MRGNEVIMEHIAVAIDGPSGAGKSTLARAAAARLGLIYVDTGAMYRAIGLLVCRKGIDFKDVKGIIAALPEVDIRLTYENNVQHILLCGEDVSDAIRTPEISKYASEVSKVPEVREYLLRLQQGMAKDQSVIMDGRDIGTVVLPDAQVKIFLTASDRKRAGRRYNELVEKGHDVTFEDVLHDIRKRDENDMTRTAAPLRQAEDAVLLDTGDMNLEQSIEALLGIIAEKCKEEHCE